MKVLIADEKETWHRLFDVILSLRGMEVLHARTPEEAVRVASSERPDVAVLDATLAGGTAYDAVKPIAQLGIPVVVIGYRAEGFDPEKAKGLGAYAVLEKPFTAGEFIQLLEKVKEEPVPTLSGVSELYSAPEESIEIVDLEEETPVETIELEAPVELPPIEEGPGAEEAEIAPLELSEGEKVEEKREELVERISQPVASELSQITSLPPERVEEIVREVAWEVIPEVAEKVIREEIEKLIKSRLA